MAMPHKRAAIQLNNSIQHSGRVILAAEAPRNVVRKVYTNDENVPPYSETVTYLSLPIGVNSDINTLDLQISPEDQEHVYWLSHRTNHPGPTGCSGKLLVQSRPNNPPEETNVSNQRPLREEDVVNFSNTANIEIPRSLQHMLPYSALSFPSYTSTPKSESAMTTTTQKRRHIQQLQNEIKNELVKRQKYENYMKSLHIYNEMKDIGQALFGKIVEMDGGVTKDLYPKYGVDLDD